MRSSTSLIVFGALAILGLAAHSQESVSGVVVNSEGKPIANVEVRARAYRPFLLKESTTDESGRFTLPARAEVAHFLASGFRPTSILDPARLPDGKVVLEDVKGSTWNIPVCGEAPKAGDRVGFTFKFFVPKDVYAGGHTDVDYTIYTVKYRHTGESLHIWTGPYAANMEPDVDYLRKSDTFSERWVSGPQNPNIGIDAAGVQKDGRKWRSCGLLIVEMARYSDASAAAAKFFNSIIDSVCLAQGALKPAAELQKQ